MLLSRPPPLRFGVEPELRDWWIWWPGGPFKLPQRGPRRGGVPTAGWPTIFEHMKLNFSLNENDFLALLVS